MARLDELQWRARYKSLSRLAEDLCKAVPEQARKPRSVGAKLSDLKKGKTVWWEGNPKFAAKLAELLSCSVSELGIHPGSAPFATYGLEGFPELKPLDLRHEAPCDLGYWSREEQDATEDVGPWLGAQSTVVSGGSVLPGIIWVEFPPGTGLDLFWHRLQVNGRFECLTKECVSDAKDRLQDPSPFCLRVSELKGAADRQALKHRAPKGSVLIVAPFSQPASSSPRSRLEKLVDSVSDSRVMEYEYRLKHDWQRLLANWLDARIRDQRAGKWSKDRLLQWISALPSPSMVASPRALVEIAGLAYRVSLDQLRVLGEEGSAQQALSLLQTDTAADQQDLFLRHVRAWFFSSDIPWSEWIQPIGWSTLTALVSTSPESSTNNPESSKIRPESPDSGKTVRSASSLIGTKFVKESATGGKMLIPRVIVEAAVTEALRLQMKAQDHSTWGTLCFDEQRSARVLDALAIFDKTELEGFAAHVTRGGAYDPATIGASEAIFSVFGRHEWDQPSESMLEIRDIVFERMVQSGDPSPQSWSAVSEHVDWWVAACWSWSLTNDQPPSPLPEGWGDYFPGWMEEPLCLLPIGISNAHQDAQLIDLPLAQQRLLYLADTIAERMPACPSASIPLFHPTLLFRSIQHGWQVRPEWWTTVLSMRWSRDALVKWIGEQKTATQTLISLFQSSARTKDAAWLLRVWLLKDSLLNQADPVVFVAALNRQQLDLVVTMFSLLPLSFRHEILNRCRDQPDAGAWWQNISHDLRSDMDKDVARWIENSGWEGDLAANWLWRESPERALSILSDHSDPRWKDRLLENFEGDLPLLNKVILFLECCTDECRPRGISTFARAQLSRSGRLSPRLITLIADSGEY